MNAHFSFSVIVDFSRAMASGAFGGWVPVDLSASDVSHSVTSFLDRTAHQVRGAFTDAPPSDEVVMELPPDQGWGESLGEMLQLTYTQRLSAFLFTFMVGLLFLFLTVSTSAMVLVAPKKFAFFLTVGNLCCLLSTTFLIGFRAQWSMMFSSHRAEAALLYITSIALTFFFAVIKPFGLMCLLMAVVQVGCLGWYCLSFIPMARRVVWLAGSSTAAALALLQRALSSMLS